MEHCAAYKKILPYLEKMRRLRTTTSIIYYDLACVAGKDAIKDESELLNHWFAELAKISQDKDFIAIVKDEWAKLKAQMPDILKTMRDYCTQIEVAQRTNFKRWPILDQYISVGLIHLGSWEAEVEYVFDFFEKRCAWFDAWLATQ